MLLSMFETHTSSLDLYSPVMNLPRCSSLYSVKFADIGSHVGIPYYCTIPLALLMVLASKICAVFLHTCE